MCHRMIVLQEVLQDVIRTSLLPGTLTMTCGHELANVQLERIDSKQTPLALEEDSIFADCC